MSKVATISVDAGATIGPLPGFASYFGVDEVNLVYYPQGSELLHKLGRLGKMGGGGPAFLRTHHLLTTGDASRDLVGVPGPKWGSTNVYTEDPDGNPVYSFEIVDRILDACLSAGVKPYLQAGFMPLALATDALPYFFDFDPVARDERDIFTGYTHPPKSYEKWEELIFQWIKHCVSRYGEEEMSSWWFECWNEPNIPYWSGTQDDFFRLHDHTINGIRRAFPAARVGGPELAHGVGRGTNWLKPFLDHCLEGTNYATDEQGTPLDFISFHAKGLPEYIEKDGDPMQAHVRMNIGKHLATLKEAFSLVASFPDLRQTPIIVGECDPDSYGAGQGKQFGYRNGLLYPAYTAAVFVRALDLAADWNVSLLGLLTWAFEYEPTDVMPNMTTYFDPFRVLSSQGIDKPIFNVLRMFAMMSGDGFERLSATSDNQIRLEEVISNGIRNPTSTDVGILSSISPNQAEVFLLIWHYHDDDVDFPASQVKVSVANLPSECIFPTDSQGQSTKIRHFRMDESHSNSYALWKAIGSPRSPSSQQNILLESAGQLALLHPPAEVEVDESGGVGLEFGLPIRGISLIVLSRVA